MTRTLELSNEEWLYLYTHLQFRHAEVKQKHAENPDNMTFSDTNELRTVTSILSKMEKAHG